MESKILNFSERDYVTLRDLVVRDHLSVNRWILDTINSMDVYSNNLVLPWAEIVQKERSWALSEPVTNLMKIN